MANEPLGGFDEREASGTSAKGELAPGLYVVATPIGNLGDVTARARDVLAGADRILCEDARISRRLLAHLGVNRPLQPYHEHNAETVRPRVLAELAAGARLALISDAGTPLVSDPGFKLVGAAIAQGSSVWPIPGASALLAALVVAGLPTDRFFFQGFLPAKAAARRSALAELAAVPATLVVYEAPHRLAEALADAAEVLGARPAAVCRELTKRFEETVRGTLPELAEHFAGQGAPRGEIVLVIGPPAAQPVEVDDATLAAAFAEAAASMAPRQAARFVAARFNLDANAVYRRVARKDGA
ncbi:MAG TPA: 16S rRNA (cytidine(1402)-2'-O)-methyltransferase [Geminicoccus sp.]|uniref:16S rRNA (cytidine(1402)-2'-O)-methyltransferase n=1 Tax=Geminicoccus sp. TaxID=2024832 RepID=UPI002C43DFF5|nr:16S rRNA (cytidine(1402)-2'-O)-methyltransferase [Geminicoccus sp.]HWL71387.1 16S rRNA (cytidine(1402)-2'-O)-methyltransferase [Geminicoccus sp.]